MKKVLLFLVIIFGLVQFRCSEEDSPTEPPSIEGISPQFGKVNTNVAINGKGFGTEVSEISVTLNGKDVTVVSLNDQQVVVRVPSKAGSGPVVVTKGSTSVTGPVFAYQYNGIVNTIAGSDHGYVDDTGVDAKFERPLAATADASGNIYVADTYNNRIRKIDASREVTTFAGVGDGTHKDGTLTTAQFSYPGGIAVANDGTIYVCDRLYSYIRKISISGDVTSIAGDGFTGSHDGKGIGAGFATPTSLAIDPQGNIIVLDDVGLIRKVTPAGDVTTIAGGGGTGSTDGPGVTAKFNFPSTIAIDKDGNVFVADQVNQRIRRITPDGMVSTVAGSAQGNKTGAVTEAMFNFPGGVAVDADNNIYVADTRNYQIKVITAVNTVYTLAGIGTEGAIDGDGETSKFLYPYSISIDKSGDLIVVDASIIRRIVLQ